MFLDRVKFIDGQEGEHREVLFLPLNCTLSCYCFPINEDRKEMVQTCARQVMPFFPFVFDLEEKENNLFVLTEMTPSVSLAENVQELPETKKRYMITKMMQGIRGWLGYEVSPHWRLCAPALDDFYTTPQGEIVCPAVWRFFQKRMAEDDQNQGYISLLLEVLQWCDKMGLPSLSLRKGDIQPENLTSYIDEMIENLMTTDSEVPEAEQTIHLDRHECVNHGDRKGEFRCRVCARFFCFECIMMVYEQPVCNQCLKNEPDKVRSFVEEIMPSSGRTQYNLWNKSFVFHFFSALLFSKESLSSIFENMSFKEMGIFFMVYVLAMFLGFSRMDFTVLGGVLAWQSGGIGLFFIASLLLFNFDNPLQILFAMLFPLMSTSILLSLPGYFYMAPLLYAGFIWSGLLTVNFLIYALKIEIPEVLISWMIVLFILFVFMGGLLTPSA